MGLHLHLRGTAQVVHHLVDDAMFIIVCYLSECARHGAAKIRKSILARSRYGTFYVCFGGQHTKDTHSKDTQMFVPIILPLSAF